MCMHGWPVSRRRPNRQSTRTADITQFGDGVRKPRHAGDGDLLLLAAPTVIDWGKLNGFLLITRRLRRRRRRRRRSPLTSPSLSRQRPSLLDVLPSQIEANFFPPATTRTAETPSAILRRRRRGRKVSKPGRRLFGKGASAVNCAPLVSVIVPLSFV